MNDLALNTIQLMFALVNTSLLVYNWKRGRKIYKLLSDDLIKQTDRIIEQVIKNAELTREVIKQQRETHNDLLKKESKQ